MKFELPNGCSRSELTVPPKDWKDDTADPMGNWFISYRFYELGYPPKQVQIRANSLLSLGAKRTYVKQLIANELDNLGKGFNPRLKIVVGAVKVEADKGPFIPNRDSKIIPCLQYAVDLKNRPEMKSWKEFNRCVQYSIAAIKHIKMDLLTLEEITPAHIIFILDACKTLADKRKKENNDPKKPIHKTFSNNTWNKYKTYLKVCFSVLVKQRVKDYNPAANVENRQVVKNLRATMTVQEQKRVNEHLQRNHPGFHRFLLIFFHSGCRISELLRMKVGDVDLERQRFKVLVYKVKGHEVEETPRTIPDIALSYWQEQLRNADPKHYVFAYNFSPGPGVLPRAEQHSTNYKSMDPHQVSVKWRKWVKDQLNIEADFYSLKHSNSQAVRKMLGYETAAKINAHKTVKMVKEVYGVDEDYDHQLLKSIDNRFGG